MSNCMKESLSKGEISLIRAIRNIDDADIIAKISGEISEPGIKVSLLIIASELIRDNYQKL